MFRFFFDIDGVILDFESSYVAALKDYFNLEVPEDYQSPSWYFSDLLTEDQMMEGWQYFINSDHLTRLPPLIPPTQFNHFFGAYPVHFITNIPSHCGSKREANLKSIGFNWQSIHYGGLVSHDGDPPLTKADIMKTLVEAGETILFVDDHPDNCLNVFEAFPEAHIWLMSRAFNQDFQHPMIRRAYQWEDILNFTKELIQ